MRLPFHQVAQSGSSDGDVPTWDSVAAELVPEPPPTGGGGGATTVKDRRWDAGTATVVDEFNDGSLDAAWVRVDGTGAVLANVDWTEGADVLSCYNKGGDTVDKFHALLRPLSGAGGSMVAGDAFVSCVTMFYPIADFSFAGLVLTDGTTFGSGNQVWAEVGGRASGVQLQAFSWTGFSTAGSSAGAIGNMNSILRAYHRIVMIGANTWRADYSPDGVSWIKGAANLSKTITPTHVGFFSSSYGTSIKHIASYEFIRRVAGIT